MKQYQLKYKRFGTRSILIEWPKKIDQYILFDVLAFKTSIKFHYIKQKVRINHAYNSILICYDNSIDNIYNTLSDLKDLYLKSESTQLSSRTLWKIPVCYDQYFGIDLERISKEKKLTIEEIISIHSQEKYLLYFNGFLPGFMYLGGLKSSLFMPRLDKPRSQIKAGDVAIGGNQTGVYPQTSPGGWNIIGNSPLKFFNVQKEMPCIAAAGDSIQFCPITIEEHQTIKKKIEEGAYEINKVLLDD
ncbi:MAG: 5-oxoprolinase subunit PxpB [Flavobacteriaceae bacterium]|nr:5-oxoprolinase subunit PxpB [Flavobacteriaceae bacterium]